jgi:hypothetical protein
MESSSHPVSPLTGNDKKVLEVMEYLGWGLSAKRISEAANLDIKDVQFALEWLERSDLVEKRFNSDQGLLIWYLKGHKEDAPSHVCPDCGKVCCNAHGLAIHKARIHTAPHKEEIVWVDRSVPDEREASDQMTMELNLKSIDFVQDLISKFATLPGAKISVTVEFSKGVDA